MDSDEARALERLAEKKGVGNRLAMLMALSTASRTSIDAEHELKAEIRRIANKLNKTVTEITAYVDRHR